MFMFVLLFGAVLTRCGRNLVPHKITNQAAGYSSYLGGSTESPPTSNFLQVFHRRLRDTASHGQTLASFCRWRNCETIEGGSSG